MATGTPFVPAALSTTSVAPSVVSENRRFSYVTPSEYRLAPTAVATSALVAGSTNQQSDSLSSLARTLERASGWVDLICFHRAEGTLAASATTESGWVSAKPDGSVALVCNFKPVLEVTGLGFGSMPSQLASIDSNTAADLWIDGKVIWVPGGWGLLSTGNAVPFFRGAVGGRLFAVWRYINGYPHTTLASNAMVGATSISVQPSSPGGSTIAGVYAGTQMTINDADSTETIVVASTPTGLTLPLSAPLQFSHTVPVAPDGIRVSALPRAVEQATISLALVLIKARGSRAMVLSGTAGGQPSRQAIAQAGGLDDYDDAVRLLKPFIVATVHG